MNDFLDLEVPDFETERYQADEDGNYYDVDLLQDVGQSVVDAAEANDILAEELNAPYNGDLIDVEQLPDKLKKLLKYYDMDLTTDTSTLVHLNEMVLEARDAMIDGADFHFPITIAKKWRKKFPENFTRLWLMHFVQNYYYDMDYYRHMFSFALIRIYQSAMQENKWADAIKAIEAASRLMGLNKQMEINNATVWQVQVQDPITREVYYDSEPPEMIEE
jgi:hypothetical protein